MTKHIRSWTKLIGLTALIWMMAAPMASWAQTPTDQSEHLDRTLSPYFFVQSDDPDTDRLPLKSTHAEVTIAGVVADVTVTQVYRNEGRNTLEAIYIFPGSTRAAVYAMKMTIGERVIVADIMERQKARQTYEQAKQEGRTASLLEQQRPNVFQMNVANILPGDTIKVELKYTELLKPEDRVYEFVYPTVVGPRYSNTPAAGAPDTEKWVENPYLHQGEPSPFAFGLKVDIRTGIPIAHLASPSHEIAVEYSGTNQAHVSLKDAPGAGTKDFVLRYRLAGGRIQTGLLLYPGKDENYFLLMMEPPDRVQTDSVTPREYIFIVDVSGSMNGFPLDVTKALMADIIGGLKDGDYINVLVFAGGSAVLSETGSLPANGANKRKAISWINAQQGGGGTEILPALRTAFDLPATDGVSRIVTVVTDGYVSVEPEAFELIRSRLGQANLFAFGIGSSVNRFLIEGMARVGLGEPFVALNPEEARQKAAMFRQYIDRPVLTDIRIAFEGLDAYDIEPSAVPDLFAARPIVVTGKFRGKPEGRIVVTGHTAAGEFRSVIRLEDAQASPENSALSLLWARQRITRLSDLNNLQPDDDRIKQVTELGLKHGLMTQYTSFVAVDKVRRADGRLETVKQPLPLPEGVSDLAVGGNAQASFSPYTKQLMAAPGVAKLAMDTEVKQEAVGRPQQSQATTRVRIEVEEVRGGLTQSNVIKALLTQQKALEDVCRKSGSGQGQVVFHLVVGPDGRIARIDAVNVTTLDASTIKAFEDVLRNVRFAPVPSGSAEVTIKLTCP